jgi:hypothetical protein
VSTDVLQERRATFTDAVARVFEECPFVAGQSAPVAPIDSKETR